MADTLKFTIAVVLLFVANMSIAVRQERQVDGLENNLGEARGERLGFSGTVVDGKSSYILKFNEGVPVYGGGEPYYFSYTHNFPITTNDFEHQVNSHNLPKKYKFTGNLDVTRLL